jgi:hypothetical protein
MTMMSGWMRSRGMIRTGRLQGLTFVEQLNEFLPAWLESSRKGALDPEAQHTTIHERLDLTGILAQQVRYQPSIEPYAYGQTFIDAGIALVPRILWRDKPSIAGGSQFVGQFTGIRRLAGDTTSVGLPYQFEFYANGGPIAVVCGLFIVGFLCASLERSLFRKANSLAVLLAGIAATMVICDGGQRANIYIPCLIASMMTYFTVGYFVQHFFPRMTRQYFGIGVALRATQITPDLNSLPARRAIRETPMALSGSSKLKRKPR